MYMMQNAESRSPINTTATPSSSLKSNHNLSKTNHLPSLRRNYVKTCSAQPKKQRASEKETSATENLQINFGLSEKLCNFTTKPNSRNQWNSLASKQFIQIICNKVWFWHVLRLELLNSFKSCLKCNCFTKIYV